MKVNKLISRTFKNLLPHLHRNYVDLDEVVALFGIDRKKGLSIVLEKLEQIVLVTTDQKEKNPRMHVVNIAAYGHYSLDVFLDSLSDEDKIWICTQNALTMEERVAAV